MSSSFSPTRSLSIQLGGVALAALAILTVACSSGSASTRTLVISQQPPELANFTIPPSTPIDPGQAPGGATRPAGVLAFDAAITDPAGRSGALIGYLLTVDLPDAITGEVLEERIGTLVFSFGDDELVVSGGTSYPANDAEMAVNEPQRRAVVGGTGSFIGARGEVVTTRNDDGTYTHTFTLLD